MNCAFYCDWYRKIGRENMKKKIGWSKMKTNEEDKRWFDWSVMEKEETETNAATRSNEDMERSGWRWSQYREELKDENEERQRMLMPTLN